MSERFRTVPIFHRDAFTLRAIYVVEPATSNLPYLIGAKFADYSLLAFGYQPDFGSACKEATRLARACGVGAPQIFLRAGEDGA